MKQYYMVDTKELKAKVGAARVSFLRCYGEEVEDIEILKAEEIWKGYPYTAPSYRIKMEQINSQLKQAYKTANLPEKVLFVKNGGKLSEVITDNSSIEIDDNNLEKVTYEEAMNYLQDNDISIIKNFAEKYSQFTEKIEQSIKTIPVEIENIPLQLEKVETKVSAIRQRIR